MWEFKLHYYNNAIDFRVCSCKFLVIIYVPISDKGVMFEVVGGGDLSHIKV
jgi:hypothetical protein